MVVSFLALALSTAPASPARHVKVGEPTPLSGSLQGLIKSDDYPPQALDRNEEGAVTFRIKVDEHGGVADCIIEKSSGSGWLDAQTCRLMWLRAKFSAARDAKGKPIPSETTARVNWAIAWDPVPAIDWENRSVMTVEAGKPVSCTVAILKAGAQERFDTVACPPDAEDSAREAGDLKKAEVVLDEQFALATPPKTPIVAGDHVVVREVAKLDYDASGNLASCTIVEIGGNLPRNAPGVCVSTTKHFLPRVGQNGAAAPFTAYLATTAFVRPK